MDAFQTFQDFHQHSKSLLNGESFPWESCLVGEQVSLITVIEDNQDEVGSIDGGLLPHDVLVVQFFHDVDLLLDVLLQERLLFDLSLVYHLYGNH